MNMIGRLRRYTRSVRGQKFRAFIAALPRPLRIIDVGGTARFWEAWKIRPDDLMDIVLINSHAIDRDESDYILSDTFIHAWRRDALSLTVEELREFDVIFSNSFVEHLLSGAEQSHIADLIVASGRGYFIQTPNKFAPIDPHFPNLCVPFFATYPRALQARLLCISALGSGERASSLRAARERMAYYNLLGRRDMCRLFPTAVIEMERPFGVPMSILAYYRPGFAMTEQESRLAETHGVWRR